MDDYAYCEERSKWYFSKTTICLITIIAFSVCLFGCSGKDSEFREAVESSDEITVIRLMKAGVDVNQDLCEKGTACHIAALANDVEMLRVLIRNGADVNRYGDVGEGVKATPLMAISGKGDAALAIAKTLIDAGANVNLSGMGRGDANMTALHGASAGGNVEMVNLLIENGSDIHKRGVNDFTALHFATLSGNISVVKTLLDKGSDVNAKALAGMTPLHAVSIRGTPEMVRFLVSRGANVKAKADNGSTPLEISGRRGRDDLVKIMKEKMTAAATAETKAPAPGSVKADNLVVVMKTSKGLIKIELYPGKAPVTVDNFLEYVKSDYYNGTIFHRVIPGFMIQGGGMTADMNKKPTGSPIINEARNGQLNGRGTIAMARARAADSATSQFFINVANNQNLNYAGPGREGYAVFGKVIEGMDVVDAIVNVPTRRSGMNADVPVDLIKIESVTVGE